MRCLYIDSISYPVANLGPGKRLAIWVDGCTLCCKGCLSVSLWNRKEYNRVGVETIFEQVIDAHPGLDGVTITGGEPFEQAEGLGSLVRLIKDSTNLDIMVYSGYTIQELKGMGTEPKKLLGLIDILIDGRYEDGNTNTKLWRGSDNQGIHLLSKRAQKYIHYIDMGYDGKRLLHIEVKNDNTLKIIGIPDRGFIKQLLEKSRGFGIKLKRLQ